MKPRRESKFGRGAMCAALAGLLVCEVGTAWKLLHNARHSSDGYEVVNDNGFSGVEPGGKTPKSRWTAAGSKHEKGSPNSDRDSGQLLIPVQRLAAIRKSPEYEKGVALLASQEVEQRYSILFGRLNLEDEKLAAFKQLLVSKANLGNDITAFVEDEKTNGHLAQGKEASDAWNAAKDREGADLERTIAATIGAQAYQKYLEFESHIGKYFLVEQLEQELDGSGGLLSADQEDALLGMLTGPQAHSSADGSAAVPATPGSSYVKVAGSDVAVMGNGGYFIQEGGAVFSNVLVTEELIDAARQTLSPMQLGKLREIRARQLRARALAQHAHLGG